MKPNEQVDVTLTTLDGEKLWPVEIRNKFFLSPDSKNPGINILRMEWDKGYFGSIENIGMVLWLCMQMPSEKTADNFFEYYFFQNQEERDSDLYEAKYGDEEKRSQLNTKYHIDVDEEMRSQLIIKYGMDIDDLLTRIKWFNAHPLEDIIELFRIFWDTIQLYEFVYGNSENVSREVVANFFVSRIVDSSIIGYWREKKVEKWLEGILEGTGVIVKKTSVNVDVFQGVDYELFENNKLLLGIQVKGSRITRWKSEHQRKQEEKYKEKNNGVQVVTIQACQTKEQNGMRIVEEQETKRIILEIIGRQPEPKEVAELRRKKYQLLFSEIVTREKHGVNSSKECSEKQPEEKNKTRRETEMSDLWREKYQLLIKECSETQTNEKRVNKRKRGLICGIPRREKEMDESQYVEPKRVFPVRKDIIKRSNS